MPHIKTAAVIGAGFAGMTAALILAREGWRVTLVERSPRVGMTGRGFFRQGVYFDSGLHYSGGLSEQGIVRRYLRHLGFAEMEILPFADACFDEIFFADTGKTVRLPIGCERMRKALTDAFPAEKDAVHAYMRAAREGFSEEKLTDLFLDARNAMNATRADVSLAAFLDGLTRDGHLRAALSIHSLLYGTPPSETPFSQHAHVAASYFDSVHTFAGGGRALVDAFEERLAEEGVAVLCGNAVTRMRPDGAGGIACLALADGTELPLDVCVCTAHPAALADMAPGLFRPAFASRLHSLEDTASAYMLFGIAEEKPSRLTGNNLFLCRDTDLEQALGANADAERGPFYVTTSPVPATRAGQTGTRKCPETSEENTYAGTPSTTRCGVVVAAPGSFADVEAWADSAPNARPEAYRAFKEAKLARIRAAVVELCPELASVRFVEGATPLTMRDYLHSPRGGLYGARHSVARFNPMPVTKIPNLWLAGQAVVAPGLMGAMISAFLACGFLLGRDATRKETPCG